MAIDKYDQKMVDAIEKHGFFGQGVLADKESPAFRYSVGFWESVKAPEVIIFGLDLNLMHDMLWEMFRKLRGGRRLEDGARWSDLIDGYDCVSRPVHPSQMREYFGYALWYRRYRNQPKEVLSAYQLFWPGVNQRLYPWERDCDQLVRDRQPRLYLPRETGLA